MKQPKVSILIPAYNAETTIKKCLASIPDRDDIEVIIYDDGSTDDTENVAFEGLQSCHLTGEVLGGGTNYGVAHAVNQLLDAATGEWVVLLGSDDWLITDTFNKVVDMLKPTLDLVYFNLEINSGEIWRLTEETKGNCCGSVKFMRREFVGDTRCDEDRKAGEDYYFYCKLLSKHPREAFTNITAKHYNYPREGSLSDRQRRGEFEQNEI